jgi:dolichyl-phosphate beta-glucosyltransferase
LTALGPQRSLLPRLLTLSLILPSYNQRERTSRSSAQAAAFLAERFPGAAELIVVDDGSRPAEALEAADLPDGVVLIRLPRNLGKGGALRAGVERARGAHVVFTDSDLPFTLEPIETTLAWLAEGADVVIGDRLHPESVFSVRASPLRRLSSLVYTFLVNHLLGLDYADTQCGYKGYRAEVAKDLFGHLEVTSFAFEVEILLRARAAGYRIRRQPLRLLHDEDSSVRLTRHAPRMLLDVVRIALRAKRGLYDGRP